jgi:Flp pilus assembly protein TadD
LLRLREYGRAIEDFSRAVQLDPKYANAYHNRSVAKRLQGDTAGAEADLATANRLK